MGDRLVRILAAPILAFAVFEHLWLLYYAVMAYLSQRREPSDIPIGDIVAIMLSVAFTSSLASAWWVFLRAKQVTTVWYERMLWVGGGMFIAPWTAVLLCYSCWMLGPVGWLLGPFFGASAPYWLIGSSLRRPDSRP